LNPRTEYYAFLGPPGTFFISIAVVFFTYVFSYACSEKAGGCPRSYYELPSLFVDTVTDPEWWKAQWDFEGFMVYFGWYVFTIVCWAVLPGDWAEGLPTRTGERIKYKINGPYHLLASLFAFYQRFHANMYLL
jgi:hypothetical protein